MSAIDRDFGRETPRLPYVAETILGDNGEPIGEARTYEDPKSLSVLSWAKTFDDHVLGNPVSIVLLTEEGAPTFIAREAMEQLKGRDPHIRIDCLLKYARQAAVSSMVIMTSNSEPSSS